MKTSTNFKKMIGGSMAAATLAGGALLAQAPAASASSDWDRLAECESGGDWSINTGNGYYGGLQFSQQSWEAAGGSGSPAQASKEEQIQAAEQLQSMQGWGAWPACSAQLGLSGSPSGGGSSEPAPEQETQQEAPQQETQEQPQQEQPQQETQEQPQQEAPQQETQEQPQQEQPQQEAPQQSYSAAGEFTAEPNADVEVGDEVHTVESGDTLASIAEELDIDWQDLWGANAETVEDPNLIFVGDELKLPVVG